METPKKNTNKILNYILYSIGLIALCFIVTFVQFNDTEMNNKYWMLILVALGNFLTYCVYALVIFGITILFNRSKVFSRYFKILLWVVLLASGALLNLSTNKSFNSQLKTNKINEKLPERATTELFFKSLKDTCEHRFKMVKSNEEAINGCACLIEKAKKVWTEDDINRKGFIGEKGVGDSLAGWIIDCFGGAGFMGVDGQKTPSNK